MRRVQQAISAIRSSIEGKDILEAACGCAEFSIAAAECARSVHCVDLVSFRLPLELGSVTFEQMDATSMTYPDASFDTVVFYNAAAHVDTELPGIMSECLRVLRPGGSLFFISSLGIDKLSMEAKLLPWLNGSGLDFSQFTDKIFTYIRIEK